MEDKVQHRTKKKQLLLDSTDQFQQLMQWTHIVPQVKLFQWEEALSHIFSQIKQSQTIRTIYSPETLDQYITKDKSTSVHKAHEQQKTHKKVLLVPDSKSDQEAKNLLRQWFEVKILPEWFPLHADIIVMDEKMYFLQYGNPMQAIEIIQPLFVNAQRALFDMIWESASTDSEGY